MHSKASIVDTLLTKSRLQATLCFAAEEAVTLNVTAALDLALGGSAVRYKTRVMFLLWLTLAVGSRIGSVQLVDPGYQALAGRQVRSGFGGNAWAFRLGSRLPCSR